MNIKTTQKQQIQWGRGPASTPKTQAKDETVIEDKFELAAQLAFGDAVASTWSLGVAGAVFDPTFSQHNLPGLKTKTSDVFGIMQRLGQTALSAKQMYENTRDPKARPLDLAANGLHIATGLAGFAGHVGRQFGLPHADLLVSTGYAGDLLVGGYQVGRGIDKWASKA